MTVHEAHRIKVLLVEDDIIAAKVVKFTLLSMGCDVDVAMTGRDALSRGQAVQYDIVFMDLGLSDMDGFSIAKKWRAMEQDGDRVPIVALTVHMESSCRRQCLAAGMDSFVSKPLTRDMALSLIRQFCYVSA